MKGNQLLNTGKRIIQNIYSPKKRRLSKVTLPQWMRSPYFLLTVSLATWMFFFDSADLITQYKLTRRIKKLYEEQDYYRKQIEIVTKERQELTSDEILLEKFAREKYLMKKSTEDVYIIEK